MSIGSFLKFVELDAELEFFEISFRLLRPRSVWKLDSGNKEELLTLFSFVLYVCPWENSSSFRKLASNTVLSPVCAGACCFDMASINGVAFKQMGRWLSRLAHPHHLVAKWYRRHKRYTVIYTFWQWGTETWTLGRSCWGWHHLEKCKRMHTVSVRARLFSSTATQGGIVCQSKWSRRKMDFDWFGYLEITVCSKSLHICATYTAVSLWFFKANGFVTSLLGHGRGRDARTDSRHVWEDSMIKPHLGVIKSWKTSTRI